MQRSSMAEDSTTTERDAPAHGPRALAVKRATLPTLGVLVLVFLIALGSSRSLAHIGGPGNLSHARHLAGSVIVLLFAIVVALATVYLAWTLLLEYSDEKSGPGERQSTWRRLLAQMAVIAMIAIVVFALAIAKPGRSRLKPRPSEQTRPGVISHLNGKSSSEQTAANLAPWVVGGALILIVLLMIAALVLRRRRYSDLEEEPLDD